ncbi:histone acetyltransferases subunit 3-domain-containing protein [Syncephalis plumigaleata]|nr:histone acetyltransferases subunit 3-domain-containing protein [Syncephalis plumigaleata]
MSPLDSRRFPHEPYALEGERVNIHKILSELSSDATIMEAGSLDLTNLPSLRELRELHDELQAISSLAETRLDRLRTDAECLKQLTEERSRPATPTKHTAPVKIDAITSTRSHGGGVAGTSSGNSTPLGRRQSIKPLTAEPLSDTRRRRPDRDTNETTVKEELPDTNIVLRGTEKRASKKGRSNQIKKGSGNNANARRNREQQQQQQQQQQQKQQQKQEQPPPDEECVRPKITNQVPIHVFWNSLEPYFRPLTDADIRFLEEKDDDVGPYLIPLLGRHYLQVWAEEDRALIPDLERNKNDTAKSDRPLPAGGHPDQILSDDLLETDAISCGPLTERIISALLRNDIGIPMDFGRDVESIRPSKLHTDLISVEERLKRELMHLDLLDAEGIDWQAAEDDEICGELRALQRELREVEAANTQRKRKLISIVHDYLGYQEYQQILDELDRHVEQSFARRHRVKKTKRKKLGGPKAGLSDTAVSALDRRRRFVDSIGRIFSPERLGIPEKSIFTT